METTREDRQRHCIRVGVGRAFRPDKKNLGEIRVPRWISFCGSKSLVFVRRCHKSLSTAAICWCTTCKQIWNSTQSLQNSRFWWQPDSSASLPPLFLVHASRGDWDQWNGRGGGGRGGGRQYFPPTAISPFPQFASVPHPGSLYCTHPRLSRFPNPRWRPRFQRMLTNTPALQATALTLSYQLCIDGDILGCSGRA